MRKYIFYLPIILLILCLSGCGKGKQVFEQNSQIYEYFPFKENVLYEYEGEGHIYASYQIYNTFISDNRLQRRLSTDVATYNKQTEIFEVKDGQLRLINGDTYLYHYENQTANQPEKDMLLLQEPLELGAKWTISGTDTAEITGVDIDITTPVGSFKALEVTSVFTSGYMQKDYYVKNIGLVQTTYSTQSDTPITSTLAKLTEDTGVSCEYKAYYPIHGTDEISVQSNEIVLNTNYNLIDTVNTILYKGSQDGVYGALLSNGKLIDINFATNTSAILVNFDKEVYDQGYTSEDEESSNLYSIAITLGKLLGVEQVFVQVDGKPYSGIYVKLTEDDAFITNEE